MFGTKKRGINVEQHIKNPFFYNKAFFLNLYIFFYTQPAFVFHLLRNFCIFHNLTVTIFTSIIDLIKKNEFITYNDEKFKA